MLLIRTKSAFSAPLMIKALAHCKGIIFRLVSAHYLGVSGRVLAHCTCTGVMGGCDGGLGSVRVL